MPIVAADLIQYLSTNMPKDDTATAGGAISTAGRVKEAIQAADDDLEVLSDNAGDTTQTVTVFARTAAGAIVSQTVTLNGTTAVIFSTLGVIERVLETTKSATTTGTITLRRSVAGATVWTLEPTITKVFRHFYDSASEAAIAIRYDKTFWKNTHATLTLSAAKVTLTADPAARIRIGLAGTKDDTATAANRKTAPASVTFSDDGVEINVPTNALAAGEAIGAWIEQNLPADDPARRSTFTTRLAGTTT